MTWDDRFQPAPYIDKFIGECITCKHEIEVDKHHYETPQGLCCSGECLREHAESLDLDHEGMTNAQIIESLRPGYIYDGKWFEDAIDVYRYVQLHNRLLNINSEVIERWLDALKVGQEVELWDLGTVRKV